MLKTNLRIPEISNDSILRTEILMDNSRLQEIYDLRVLAWENSHLSQQVNCNLFPDGWKDKLDDSALHWVIKCDELVIASSRINMIEPALPGISPQACFSRLIVHPDFRRIGVARMMDRIRIEYVKTNSIKHSFAYVDETRLYTLMNYGFKYAGKEIHRHSNEAANDMIYKLTLDLNDITEAI